MRWSCHLMRCECLCCVMSRDATRCHVMCPAMVTLCVRSGSVTMWWSKVLFCTTKYYCVLQSTTPVLLCTTMYYNVLLQYYSVLQSTTPVLLCTAKYYSSTTLYYKVLLQYYSVLQGTTQVLLCTTKYYSSTTLYYTMLQRTTPVLLCTTKYYSSTILYCKVLLQYYSVLHSTTTYYSSTTLYYKVLLQYYSVLQNTTPVLLCSTQYYNVLLQYYSVLQSSIHDWSLTHMNRHLHDWCPSHLKRHLQCAEQQESSSNFTKYCTCHAKWLWWLIRVTYETSFTMRGATEVTIQPHQILRLPRKMNLMIDPRLTWNIIYNARSNKSQPPTSPNTAPATQNESHDWSASHMKRHLQCAEQQESASHFTKYCACHAKWISWLIRIRYETSFTMRGATLVTVQHHQILRLPGNSEFKISPQNPWIVSANRKTIRRQSDHDPSMKSSSRTRRFGDLTRPILETILYWKIQRFALRLSPKMSRNAAPATKSHTPTSPNTAPATPNETHHWSASRMKRHLQCAEQQVSPSNFTKYCACHAKWISWLIRIRYETSFTMREASKVNLQPHQILRLPRKMNLMIDPRHIWNVIYNAQSKHSQPPTSPNTAPATKSVSSRFQRKLRELLPPIERRFDDNPTTIRPWSEHEIVISHPPLRRPYSSDLEHDFVLKNTTFRAPAISQNVTKCCACHEKSHSNFTNYCACQAKCISWLIRVSYETSFPMRRASKVNLQPQQILRLPRKMNPMINPRHTWNVIYNARSMHSQPPTSPNTAPATKSASSRLQRKLRELLPPIERRFDDNPTTIRPWSEHEIVISHPPLRRPYSSDLGDDFVLKNTTFRAPAISQNVTKCCACHEKSHSNFTKYCACHAKWISWLIRVTYETSFTMRGATNRTPQLHQILRLPRKMNHMIDPRHIWNVIYNARSKHSQLPTSPNTAPATKSVSSTFQRKPRELLPPIERRFDDIPTIIRR